MLPILAAILAFITVGAANVGQTLEEPPPDTNVWAWARHDQSQQVVPANTNLVAPFYMLDPLGAAHWSQLNYPQPVASADLDLNRGVSREEFGTVARRRFGMIAVAGAITMAGLKPTPAQQEAARCAAEQAKKRR